MDLIEDTLKLNAEKMDECERESNNNSEHLEIAEKQAKEFRTKAAVGFGLTSGEHESFNRLYRNSAKAMSILTLLAL